MITHGVHDVGEQVHIIIDYTSFEENNNARLSYAFHTATKRTEIQCCSYKKGKQIILP